MELEGQSNSQPQSGANPQVVSLLSFPNSTRSLEHEQRQLLALADLITARLGTITHETASASSSTESTKQIQEARRPMENGHRTELPQIHDMDDEEFNNLMDTQGFGVDQDQAAQESQSAPVPASQAHPGPVAPTPPTAPMKPTASRRN